MQQIWTNPSLERSFIQASITKSELLEYLKVQISQDLNNFKEIMIFPNMEYNFTFYDANFGTLRSLTALVTNVYEDQIKIKYIQNKTNDKLDCSKCKKDCFERPKIKRKREKPMPTCNCILNPPDISKYDEPKIYFIPISNLVNVSYIKTEKKKEKGDVKVMLLGISATMVKAIIVRLEFFDDSIQDAVKLVDLKAGGIYDIAYEADGTIYESRAKVIKIEEDKDHKCMCKPGKGFVRENIGCDNMIYHSYNHDHDKDDFMNEPPVPIVRIIVDTSEDFHGRYETIMLHTIRDCTLVEEPSDEESDFPTVSCCDGCVHKTETCDPETCTHYIHEDKHNCNCNNNETFTYTYDNAFKAIVNGEDVTLYIRGEKTKTSLESLVKYYLGVD